MCNKCIKLAALFLALGSGAASAQNFYIGGNIGQSNTKLGSFSLPPEASEYFTLNKDTHTSAWKIFAGYEFNKYLAVEGGYADLGKPQVKLSGKGDAQGFEMKEQSKHSSWFVVAKGTVPLSEQFALFGRFGLAQNTSKWTVKTNNAKINEELAKLTKLKGSEDKTRPLYGLGAEYSFSKQFGLRLEYENFGKFGDGTKTELWSLGARYSF